MAVMWNLWHGCHKHSAGCLNCYVFRGDAKRGIDSEQVVRTRSFDLPVQRKKRTGEYRVSPGTTVYTCFTSDFFVEEADRWRVEAWAMIRERSDLDFFIITKRIERFHVSLPDDWGEGYDNVSICCTVENQDRADHRLPIFACTPVKHKYIACEPLLGPVDLTPYLSDIKQVMAGGESGSEARVCDCGWVLDLRDQCVAGDVSFRFRQTGTKFRKDWVVYTVPRHHHFSQARKAGLDYKSLF